MQPAGRSIPVVLFPNVSADDLKAIADRWRPAAEQVGRLIEDTNAERNAELEARGLPPVNWSDPDQLTWLAHAVGIPVPAAVRSVGDLFNLVLEWHDRKRGRSGIHAAPGHHYRRDAGHAPPVSSKPAAPVPHGSYLLGEFVVNDLNPNQCRLLGILTESDAGAPIAEVIEAMGYAEYKTPRKSVEGVIRRLNSAIEAQRIPYTIDAVKGRWVIERLR